MHISYGSTRVFLTIEPQELLCVRDAEPRSWISKASGRGLGSLAHLRKVVIRPDFRLLLNRDLASHALESLREHLSADCTVLTEPLAPRSMLNLFRDVVGHRPDNSQEAETSTEILISRATCHPFIDLVGSLGEFAYPNGGTGLVECLDEHASGNDDKAIALLLEPLRDAESGPLLAFVDASDLAREPCMFDISADADDIQTFCKEGQTPGSPDGMTALVGSLGGEPNDSVPSVGIPYLLSILSSWSSEVSGFVAMWDQALMDLPMFASSGLRHDEIRARLERRFDWHDLVLYAIRSARTDERIRLVTSMPPVLVAKTLGWKVQETGADLLRSMKRASRGEFKLAVIRDVSMTFLGRSKPGETEKEN